MSRRPNPIPSYRRHKKTGRAIVTVRDHLGVRRDVLLPGPYGSNESRQEYERLCAQLRANGGLLPADKPGDLTVAELILRYVSEHVTTYYVHPDGKPTNEQTSIRVAMRPLNRLFGSLPVAEFDCPKLEIVRNAMMTGAWLTDAERAERQRRNQRADWCRNLCNKAVHRIRAMFRWGLAKRLVPATVMVELQAVTALKRGRTAARETEPVRPVDVALVERTLPFCPAHVRAMVQVQLLTGMRPGEVCSMRVRDLDMTGQVWSYRPNQHKTAHHGHQRIVSIGPKAQTILRDFLTPNLDAHLFGPAAQAVVINAEKRARRKSKVQPSQVNRAKRKPKRQPGPYFTVCSYGHSVRRACERAGVAQWHPHQLRHTASLLIERDYGLEAARATLGHRTVNQTTMYSGLDAKRAAEVASKIG